METSARSGRLPCDFCESISIAMSSLPHFSTSQRKHVRHRSGRSFWVMARYEPSPKREDRVGVFLASAKKPCAHARVGWSGWDRASRSFCIARVPAATLVPLCTPPVTTSIAFARLSRICRKHAEGSRRIGGGFTRLQQRWPAICHDHRAARKHFSDRRSQRNDDTLCSRFVFDPAESAVAAMWKVTG